MLLEAFKEENKEEWLEHLPQSVLSGKGLGQCHLIAHLLALVDEWDQASC